MPGKEISADSSATLATREPLERGLTSYTDRAKEKIDSGIDRERSAKARRLIQKLSVSSGRESGGRGERVSRFANERNCRTAFGTEGVGD